MAKNNNKVNNRSKNHKNSYEYKAGSNNKNKNYRRATSRDNRDDKDLRTAVSEDTKKYNRTGSANYDVITTNDIKWWNKAKGIYEYATRVPFNKLAGATYPWAQKANVVVPLIDDTIVDNNAAIPTLMRIGYVPGIGVAETHTDAPNRAFQAMYSAVYSKTTGVLQFTPYALAMYVIGIQSIAQNIALAKRALEVSNMWHAQNIALPRGILEAIGIVPDSVLNHQNDVATKINNRIKDFNTMKVPAYVEVFERHYALAHNIWADADSVRAQFTAFVPDCYYVYSDLGKYNTETQEYDGLATLVPVKFAWANHDPEEMLTIEELLDIIDLQIKMMRNSADYTVINGSLQRAFPDSSFLAIELVTPDMTRIPVEDKVMNYQIHNMDLAGTPIEVSTSSFPNFGIGSFTTYLQGAIAGDPVANLLMYKPLFNTERTLGEPYITGVNNEPSIINFFDASEVRDDMVMEATRLKSVWEKNGTSITSKVAKSIGTEIPTTAHIFNFVRTIDGSLTTEVIEVPRVYSEITDINGELIGTNNLKGLMALNKFHLAPRVLTFTGRAVNSQDYTIEFSGVSGDLLYWTQVDASSLKGLHDAALLSVFSTDEAIAIK